MNLWRWCLQRTVRLTARLREERAHNRHLVQVNERLTGQNDTLRLKLIDLGIDPSYVDPVDEVETDTDEG